MSPFRTRLLQLLTPTEPTHQIPARGDQFEQWLKARRDQFDDELGRLPAWWVLDDLLEDYQLHAATGTPLSEHVCEAGNRDDCGHKSHPF